MQQGDDTIFQDAAATFRSLKLNDSYQAEGEGGNDDSSSSSSSNEEADVSLRMPPSVVMQVCCLHSWPLSISGLSIAAMGSGLGFFCHVPEIPVICQLILMICVTACTNHVLNCLTCVQRRLSDDEDMVVMDMDDYSVVVGSSVSNALACFNNHNSSSLPPQDVFSPSHLSKCIPEQISLMHSSSSLLRRALR